MKAAAAALAFAVALTACTGSVDPRQTPRAVAATPTAQPLASETSAEPPGVPIEGSGLDEVALVSPDMTGAGDVPTFVWEPVEAAKAYRLFVVDGDGVPIWSWEGRTTSVALGGLSVERPEGDSGPVLAPGSTWSVAALDGDRQTLAVSRVRPVSP